MKLHIYLEQKAGLFDRYFSNRNFDDYPVCGVSVRLGFCYLVLFWLDKSRFDEAKAIVGWVSDAEIVNDFRARPAFRIRKPRPVYVPPPKTDEEVAEQARRVAAVASYYESRKAAKAYWRAKVYAEAQ